MPVLGVLVSHTSHTVRTKS